MVDNNILKDKSIAFAIRTVNCYKFLEKERNERVMSKQLLRCGTSIGANIHEGIYGQSVADFVSKLSIALKEASETSYWLLILHDTDFLSDEMHDSLKSDIDSIIKLLISSLKTTKKNWTL